jgi:UDP-glucose 4-epimerase
MKALQGYISFAILDVDHPLSDETAIYDYIHVTNVALARV